MLRATFQSRRRSQLALIAADVIFSMTRTSPPLSLPTLPASIALEPASRLRNTEIVSLRGGQGG